MERLGIPSIRTRPLLLREAARHFLAPNLMALCLLIASCEEPRTPSEQELETRISVLQVNLRSVLDVPFGDSSENWVASFNRIGADLQRQQVTPDERL
jgi:hypothetical protein